MERSVLEFGELHQVPGLAETVLDLYSAALRESSQKTYKTGQRAYFRFCSMLKQQQSPFPFEQQELSPTELTLAFYMASLLLEPTIKSGSTVIGYENHVKHMFRSEGCPPWEYQTAFLGQVRKGVKNTVPAKPGSRLALLLPSFKHKPEFQRPRTREEELNRFSTILCFVGLLRPHTLAQLGPSSFTMVTTRTVVQGTGDARKFKEDLRWIAQQNQVLGFYIQFHSKTVKYARAYLPNLCTSNPKFEPMCPMKALLGLASQGLVKKGFLKNVCTNTRLSTYLKFITNIPENVAPYAHRIGGRTWLITKGMDRQLVDYLGNWKSPEASARYFRANPAAALQILRRFYMSLRAEDIVT